MAGWVKFCIGMWLAISFRKIDVFLVAISFEKLKGKEEWVEGLLMLVQCLLVTAHLIGKC
jgi:hypothetical protein